MHVEFSKLEIGIALRLPAEISVVLFFCCAYHKYLVMLLFGSRAYFIPVWNMGIPYRSCLLRFTCSLHGQMKFIFCFAIDIFRSIEFKATKPVQIQIFGLVSNSISHTCVNVRQHSLRMSHKKWFNLHWLQSVSYAISILKIKNDCVIWIDYSLQNVNVDFIPKLLHHEFQRSIEQ